MQQNLFLQQQLIGHFYQAHHAWLNTWLRKKLGCAFDAADIAQDTFVKVVFQSDVTTIQEPRAFLTTTATRLVIDFVRRRRIESSYLQALSQVQSEEACASPEQIKEAVETLNQIALMLEGLPEKVYRAFLMCRLEELSYLEIAEVIGVSTSMVKQYIAQAMLHCYQIAYQMPETSSIISLN